jgi:hypothetical protein
MFVFIAGRHQHRSLRRQIQRREEIVGDAVGELADDVRGGRATSSRSMLDASEMCSMSEFAPARTGS